MSTFISVFTATYNRAYCLDKVYDSLLQQTSKDFEWIIVDDGSNDGTRELVLSWIRENKLKINYHYQLNQGKPSAWNQGLDMARGELFVNLDSDDFLLPDSIAVFQEMWNKLEYKDQFYGVVGLTIDSKGKIVGDKFPQDIFDSNSIDLQNIYNITGEKRGALVTAILRDHKFPKYEGEKFVPEGLIWTKLAKSYKQRYFNIPVTIYDSQRPDSFTVDMGRVRYRNKFGYLAYYKEMCSVARLSPINQLKYYTYYFRMKLHCHKSFFDNDKIFPSVNPLYVGPALLMAGLLFIYDKYKYTK